MSETTKAKTITVNDVMSQKPCWSRERVELAFAGKARLSASEIACFMDSKTQRLFAIWCAPREVLKLVPEPNPRSVAACDVAERFANGEATEEELTAARDAAWGAAGTAAWDAALDAQLNRALAMIEQNITEESK